MMNFPCINFFYLALSVLVISEDVETLLPDPYHDELISSAQSTNLELDGAMAEARAAGCQFREELKGRWFQSGIQHSITITRDGISTKGHCVERSSDKYLMYNRRDNCYKCLVFNEKHENVLQYKETFCIPEKRSLRDICSTITGDAQLYTMFRLDAVPIDCPFKGQFTMSYNRGHGDCNMPISNINSCTKSSRLVFNYQACPDVYGTESSVEDLQCLATWKEGSYRYLVGLISYQHHASYEERFRCFVYERSKHDRGEFGSSLQFTKFHHTGNATSEQIFRVAQSGDASCNGLSAISEGSRTMILKKVPPAKPCHFPSWIQTQDHSHWHTLDQGSTYTFHSGVLRVSNFSELAGTGPNSLAMTASCYHVLEGQGPGLNAKLGWDSDFDPTSVVILHATSECKTGYVCTALHHRDDNIMEIQFGTMARRAEDACQMLSHFNPSYQPYVTLVSSTSHRTQCPNVGHYRVSELWINGNRIGGEEKACRREEEEGSPERDINEDNNVKMENSMTIGCSSSNSMQLRVKSNCDGMDVLADYHCQGWWSDGKGKTYVVTTRSSSHGSYRPQRHCFAFHDLSWAFSCHPEKQGKVVHYSPEDFSDDDHHQFEGYPNANNGHHRRGRNNNNGKVGLLEFSSFADSCHRNVALGREGDFAFNLTRIGECSDINSTPAAYSSFALISLGITLSISFGMVVLF